MIVVGIDPSLTSTGIAVIDTDDVLVVEVATVGEEGHQAAPWVSRRARIVRTARAVLDLVPPAATAAFIESPSLGQRNAAAAHDRAGLWWELYAGLTHAGMLVVPVSPASRAKYATGKGNAGKDAVLLGVARRYPQAAISGNDEADAVALAALGARALGHPIEDRMPAKNLEAVAAVAAQIEAERDT